MKRRILVAIVLIGCLAGVGFWVWRGSTQNASTTTTALQTATVARGSLVATVNTAGNVSAPTTVALAFTSSGRVAQVNVKVGDVVKKGQILMQLDTKDLASTLKTAKLSLADAQASYDSAKITNEQNPNQLIVAKATLDSAAVAVQKAQADYDTVAWRGDVGMTTQAATLQTATITYQSALASYKIAASSVNDIALKQAKIKLDEEQVAVEDAQRNLENAKLVATMDGVVSEVNYAAGDTASSTAVSIVDESQLQVKVTTAEVDIAKIRVGQVATMTLDALTDKTYNAKVVSISPVGTVSSGVVNYTVTMDIADNDGSIKPGMTANLAIEVDRRDNALLIPTRALHTQGTQKLVTVLSNGKTVPTTVVTGLSNDTSIEVTSGLKQGDVVVLNATTTTTTTNAAGAGGLGILGIGGGSGAPPN